MSHELVDLIQDYLADARYVTNEMRAAFGVAALLEAQREHRIPREGTVGDNISFKFHGAGCRIFFGPREINIEFGQTGECKTFDAWRLWQYSATSPKYGGITVEAVQQELNTLKDIGIIRQTAESSMYELSNAAR